MGNRSSLAALVCLLFVGCAWNGRGRALLVGRPPFEVADPSGLWTVDSDLPWGSGHTLEVHGPGPVFHVVRRDVSGVAIAFGTGVAEGGQFIVGYSGTPESNQVAVYHVGEPDIEGVWADGRSIDLGTEEWDGVGTGDPFLGTFATYGTNPNHHGVYRMSVTVADVGGGVFELRWYSSGQEFVGTGFRIGDRLAAAAVLTYQDSDTHPMWSQRGYALAAYDLTSGAGEAMFRASAEGQGVLGHEHIRR